VSVIAFLLIGFACWFQSLPAVMCNVLLGYGTFVG